MRGAQRAGAIALLLLCCLALGAGAQQVWPSGLAEALRAPARLQLVSLDPSQPPSAAATSPGGSFHGWAVLGSAQVEGEEAVALAHAFLDSVPCSPEGEEARCFAPRHALEVGDFHLVICFECRRARIFDDGTDLGTLRLSRAGEAVFRQSVERHGLAWQGWSHDGDGSWRAAGLVLPAQPGFPGHSQLGSTLCLTRLLERDPSEQARPMATAILVATDGKTQRMPVGTQEMKGLDDLIGPLRSFGPAVEIERDDARHTLTCRGTAAELESVALLLRFLSQLEPPRTEIWLTNILPPERAAERLSQRRQEWETKYDLHMAPGPAPQCRWPVHDVLSGQAVARGVNTRFSLLVLGDGPWVVTLETVQADLSAGPDLLQQVLSTIELQPLASPSP
jgi:hypothetical protein